MSDIFLTDLPAHEKYGFGSMRVGEVIQVDLATHGVTAIHVRGHISAHGQYYNKKFKTKTKDRILHIKRIA